MRVTLLLRVAKFAAIFLFPLFFPCLPDPLWPAASKRQTPLYGKGNFRPVDGNETSRLGNLSGVNATVLLFLLEFWLFTETPPSRCYPPCLDFVPDEVTASLSQSIETRGRGTPRINCNRVYYRLHEDISNKARMSDGENGGRDFDATVITIIIIVGGINIKLEEMIKLH